MMQPLVSVVIPCLNRARLLRPTLESVLQQDYSRLECIVVDGGSDDETLDLLRDFEGRVRWISEPDRGPSEAINKGWQMAGGDILAWLNADDLWAPGAARTAVSYLSNHPEVDVVYGDCGLIDHRGAPIALVSARDWDLRYAVEHCDHIIYQPASFMRRSILERAGWLWPKLCHDHELWLRIALAGGKIQRIPAVLGYARHHAGNLGYRPEIVVPLKVEITSRFFDHEALPEALKHLRRRALSNAYLRGIDYTFLASASLTLKAGQSLALVRQAVRTDPWNLIGITRKVTRLMDLVLAAVLRRYLSRELYEALRHVKRLSLRFYATLFAR
ncbi:MAG TPA: glycosyltransferase family 2 protein [Candidatus Acidoferrales bacterium]|nr:glycosyltransferase family 2 protein [Candidatus Acidoferrales bacterium]